MVKSKVLIDIDDDLKNHTAEEIRKKAVTKKWDLKTTIIDDLDQHHKSKTISKINIFNKKKESVKE